ncbi:transcription factor HES-5-like [Chanos chanos]|uniref:Transcription factor HES-5 n=1 Tax=Chanos chanos TaxID=29144 RepID=A0A6J2VLC7_CHACN|nr:transcription factor HES-5-like [Chanos chanos]
MAPTITSTMTFLKENQSLTNKLRKPVVEKMRRDRINNSIEQLKSLLSAEFLNQQPDSKLEKADILEMTVLLLRQKQQQQQQQSVSISSSVAVNQGFSRCVQEAVHFLSRTEVKTQSQRGLLNHLQNLQSTPDNKMRENVPPQLNSQIFHTIRKEKKVQSSIWRPW